MITLISSQKSPTPNISAPSTTKKYDKSVNKISPNTYEYAIFMMLLTYMQTYILHIVKGAYCMYSEVSIKRPVLLNDLV